MSSHLAQKDDSKYWDDMSGINMSTNRDVVWKNQVVWFFFQTMSRLVDRFNSSYCWIQFPFRFYRTCSMVGEFNSIEDMSSWQDRCKMCWSADDHIDESVDDYLINQNSSTLICRFTQVWLPFTQPHSASTPSSNLKLFQYSSFHFQGASTWMIIIILLLILVMIHEKILVFIHFGVGMSSLS